MAVAAKPKLPQKQHRKRTGTHHRQTKHYMKSYWPYLPMVAVVASGFVISSVLQRPMVLGAHSDDTPSSLLQASDQAREADHKTDLQLNTQLSRAAQAKADDMARSNYWSHTSPDGRSPWSFITASGYQYYAAAENLAYGFDDADIVTNAWLHSPEHRENLLNYSYTEVGYGVSQAPDYLGHGPETITVALYARPAGAAAVTASAPQTLTPASSVSVSRVQATTASAFSGFIVGAIGASALLFVLFRHAILWRRLVNRSELFVIHHPIFDISLISVATVAVILSQTVGFIR